MKNKAHLLFTFLTLLLTLFVNACNSTDVKADDQTMDAANIEGNGLLKPAKANDINSNSANGGEALGKDGSEVLVDMRKSNYPKPDAIGQRESEIVKKYVYGKKQDSVNAATVARRLNGAFTKSGAEETVYFVTGGNIDGSRFEMQSQSWLVIFEKSTPVAKIQVDAQTLLSVTDVNGDGLNELLLCDGFTGNGETIESCSLYQPQHTKLKEIVKASYDDDCGAFEHGGTTKAELVSFTPTQDGTIPKFISSYFSRRCESKGLWTKLSKNPFK